MEGGIDILHIAVGVTVYIVSIVFAWFVGREYGESCIYESLNKERELNLELHQRCMESQVELVRLRDAFEQNEACRHAHPPVRIAKAAAVENS